MLWLAPITLYSYFFDRLGLCP